MIYTRLLFLRLLSIPEDVYYIYPKLDQTHNPDDQGGASTRMVVVVILEMPEGVVEPGRISSLSVQAAASETLNVSEIAGSQCSQELTAFISSLLERPSTTR